MLQCGDTGGMHGGSLKGHGIVRHLNLLAIAASLSTALWTPSVSALEITDATGCRVVFSDLIERVTVAGANARVVLHYQVEPDDAALDRVLAGAKPGDRSR